MSRSISDLADTQPADPRSFNTQPMEGYQSTFSQLRYDQPFEDNAQLHQTLTERNQAPTQQGQYSAEQEQIAAEIRKLFEGEADVAEDILNTAKIIRRPINSTGLLGEGMTPETRVEILFLRSSPKLATSHPPVYPNPLLHQQVPTLTSPANHPAGFLYSAPYPAVEHDYAAEANIYAAEKKDARKRDRAAKRAADLRANKPTSPPRPTGYGRAMGNDRVGTLRHLGINWEDGEEEK